MAQEADSQGTRRTPQHTASRFQTAYAIQNHGGKFCCKHWALCHIQRVLVISCSRVLESRMSTCSFFTIFSKYFACTSNVALRTYLKLSFAHSLKILLKFVFTQIWCQCFLKMFVEIASGVVKRGEHRNSANRVEWLPVRKFLSTFVLVLHFV